jgi:hypothetical protein
MHSVLQQSYACEQIWCRVQLMLLLARCCAAASPSTCTRIITSSVRDASLSGMRQCITPVTWLNAARTAGTTSVVCAEIGLLLNSTVYVLRTDRR